MNEEKKALLEKERARISQRMSPEMEKFKDENQQKTIGCFIGFCLLFIFIIIPASFSSEKSQSSYYNSPKALNKYDISDNIDTKISSDRKTKKITVKRPCILKKWINNTWRIDWITAFVSLKRNQDKLFMRIKFDDHSSMDEKLNYEEKNNKIILKIVNGTKGEYYILHFNGLLET